MIRLYAAIIDIPGKGSQHVIVKADDSFKARALLEAQYGRVKVRNVHAASNADLARAGGTS